MIDKPALKKNAKKTIAKAKILIKIYQLVSCKQGNNFRELKDKNINPKVKGVNFIFLDPNKDYIKGNNFNKDYINK